ncbi:MAG: hypothetical protein P1U81_18310 [Verrucomicrobiales bacterium]|nr:hypothetical protein [Verrucomicrobiales bacterium]
MSDSPPLIYDNRSFAMPYRFLAEFRSGAPVRRAGVNPPDWAARFFS